MRILGKDKFESFDGFLRYPNREVLTLTLSNKNKITCTYNHKFLMNDDNLKEASQIKTGDILSTGLLITDIIKESEKLTVYDALNVSETHLFYANGAIHKNCNLLYIDEAAFVQGWPEFSSSVLPTISSGKHTKLILTSTPNGLNHFYDYYNGAKKGTNGFKLIEVKWNEVPGRDEKWRQETLATINHDEQKFDQEYCVGFQGSSGTLISGAKLKELFTDIKPPIERNDGYGYKVWKMPRKNRIYCIIVDVSRGKAMDYSAFQVIDITETPYQQVATFKNNMITPSDYTSFIYQTAKAYNEAYALIEINDIGGQVADILGLDYGYENVIYTESAGAKGRRVSTGFGGNTIDRGIRTTKTVKSLGCSMLKLLIEQNTLEIYDADTINELAVFSKQGDSYEAEAGYNDDLVMCLVLLAWLSTDTYFKHLNDSDIMHSLRDLTDAQVYESLVPFGIIHGAWDEDEPIVERIGGEDWTLQDYNGIDNIGNNW